MVWGVWLARNHAIFQDDIIPPINFVSKSVYILDSLPQNYDLPKQKNFIEECIDKSISWCFLGGASQNEDGGVGGILHLSEVTWHKFAIGIGRASNNMAKMKALKLVLSMAFYKGVQQL